MAARPRLILPDGTERELAGEVSIGRGEENDIALAGASVSRQHARVLERSGRWFVEDRGSYNGTFLNGVRIHAGSVLPLRHADRLGVGSESLVFASPAEDDDADETAPIQALPRSMGRPLSPLQTQVVQVLCASWLAGGTLEDLPSNEEIAAQLGTPGAVETVKAALRRAYAKAGLTAGSPHAKRRALCRIARQRGWV